MQTIGVRKRWILGVAGIVVAGILCGCVKKPEGSLRDLRQVRIVVEPDDPGDVIDIIRDGTGGAAHYYVNLMPANQSSPTDPPNAVDDRFISAVTSVRLVDDTSGTIQYYELPVSSSDPLNITFDDGRKVEILRGAPDERLIWRCRENSAAAPILLGGVSTQGLIPPCLKGTVTEIRIGSGSGSKSGNAVIITTK